MASTISQPKKRLNVLIDPRARRRINTAAGAQDLDPGDIVTALAMEHLPAVPNEDTADSEASEDAA
jgi:hypothetical protein